MYAMQYKINYQAESEVKSRGIKKFSPLNCDPDIKLHINLKVMFSSKTK
jgi:hypothetical protein